MPKGMEPYMQQMMEDELACAAIGEGNILLNCLKKLKESGFQIVHVFTNTSAVHSFCDDEDISHSPRNANIEDILAAKPITYLFSISNPRILSESVLKIPSQLAINYHDSPLPAYAGVHSTSWAILNGEIEHGISWHIAEVGIATGDILRSEKVKILKEDSALSLNLKCQDAALAAFSQLTKDIRTQSVKRTVQSKVGRSYYGLHAIPPNLGVLSFEKESADLFNLARALEFGHNKNALGSPKLRTEAGEFFLITNSFIRSEEQQNEVLPGTIVDTVEDSILVKTKDGALWVSLANIDGSHLSEFNFKAHGLSTGKRISTHFKVDTSNLTAIRRKESYWVREIEQYDPTMFCRQRLNAIAGVGEAEEKVNLEKTIINLPCEGSREAEFYMAAFVAFLGRTCCTSTLSLGILSSKAGVPEEVRKIYADICPLNINIQMEESAYSVIESCEQYICKHQSLKTFLKDVFYRYPELRGRKQTPHHNIVLGKWESTGSHHELILHRECNILLLFSETVSELHVLLDKRPGQDFAHITDVLKHFHTFMSALQTKEIVPLCKVPLLSKYEREKLYPNAFTFDEESTDLFKEIEHISSKFGSKIALRTSTQSISYTNMIRYVNIICRVLQDVVRSRKTVIGIHLPNSVGYVISVLSVYKVGHVFLPLPLDYPKERILFTLQDSKADTVITTMEKTEIFACKGSIINTTEIAGEQLVLLRIGNNHAANQDLSQDTMYIMYTSGSTGKPKGVCVHQKGVYNLAHAQKIEWNLNENDIIGQFASIGFDATISEIFTSLVSGATLAIFSEKERLGHEFITAVNNLRINTITLTPSILNIYDPKDMPWLRKLVTAGEVCTLGIAIKWTSGTKIRFFNAYGPTETTVCATCHEFIVSTGTSIENVNQELPIGKAIQGAYVCLLDDFRQPVPPNVIGEIYIGGRGLCNGYIGHAEQFNSTRFIQNPLCSNKMLLYKTGDHGFQDQDGNITVVGRLDDMVKIRGQRVDLSEIENILIQHPKVEIAAVVVHKCSSSSEKLVAAYVAPPNIYISELKEYLIKILPRYMIPTYICKLEEEEIPLNFNGKIDRPKLERDESVHSRMKSTSETKTHLNEVQLAIAKLWCKVLNLDPTSVYTFNRQTSFSELGGNSLQLVLLQRAFEDDLGLKLSFTDVGTADTIEEFEDVVKRNQDVHKKNDKLHHADENKLRQMILEDSDLKLTPLAYTRSGSMQSPHFRPFLHMSNIRYPKNVLISGVTGFLGAYLLSEILEQTDARVSCMVRESTEARGLVRIRENMRRYDLWKFEYQTRIAIVISDLSQPRLGIAPDIYQELTQVVDAVFMNAAKINFNTGYEDHRVANVASTKEFISFAMTGVQKYIFATSSLGVFLFPKRSDPKHMIYYEKDFLDDPLQVAGGYGKSKWASEKLIMGALDYLPGGAIFRPARISGCSTTGLGPKDDLFASTMIGMRRLGCYPDIDFPYDLTPVDYVAKAMVEISVKICNEACSNERVYHLFNKSTMPFYELFNDMDLQGYSLEEWRKKLLAAPKENEELIPLTPFFMSHFWEKAPTWPIFDTTNTDRLISETTKLLLRPSKDLLKVYKNYFGL